jgi:hypothetical protein
MKNYLILLINHNHQGRVTLELQANHEVHAARKAEKMAGTNLGWEAFILH